MDKVFMYAGEVNASCGKIRVFLEQEESDNSKLRQVLQGLENCYNSSNREKFISCHNQMIESTRNNCLNNQEYHNFTQYMKNAYEEIKQRNLKNMESKEGEMKK